MRNAYARAGVGVDIEAEASRIMYEASKKTYGNRKGEIVGRPGILLSSKGAERSGTELRFP